MFKKHFSKLIVIVLLLSMVLAMAVSCKDPEEEVNIPKPKPKPLTSLQILGDMFGKIAGGYNVDPTKEFSLDFAVDFKVTEDEKSVSDLQFVAKGNFDFAGANDKNNLLLEVRDNHTLANNKFPFGIFFEGTADGGNIIVTNKNEDGTKTLTKINAFSIKHLFDNSKGIASGTKIGTNGARVELPETVGMIIDLLADVTSTDGDYKISITKEKILGLLDLVKTVAGSNEALDDLLGNLLKADIKVSPIIESLLSILNIDEIDKDGKVVLAEDGITPLKIKTLGKLADWVRIKFPTDFSIDITADFDASAFLGLNVNLNYAPNKIMADSDTVGNKNFDLKVAMNKFAIVETAMTAEDMIKDTFMDGVNTEALEGINILKATIEGKAIVEKDVNEVYTWSLDMDINPFVLIYGNETSNFENFGSFTFDIRDANNNYIIDLSYDSATNKDEISIVIGDNTAQIIDIQVLKKMFIDKKSASDIIEYIFPSLTDMPALPEISADQAKEFGAIANIMGIVMGVVPVVFDVIQSVSYDESTYFANINIAKLFASITKAFDTVKAIFSGKPADGETPAVPGAIAGKETEIVAIIDYIYNTLIKPLDGVKSFKISVEFTEIWNQIV